MLIKKWKIMKKLLMIIMVASFTMPIMAQSDDAETGLWMSAEAQKKINSQWSISGEAEYRLRENLGSTDRWTLSLGTVYKPLKWLKFDAGYKFMRVLNDDKTSYKSNGVDINKWTPSYWNTKHRAWASVTGTMALGRFDLSLRERWQYTYRPETTVQRYDVDEDEWEDKVKDGKAQHVLRSRVQLEYDIPRCKVEPYVSAEFYNASGGLKKIRYTVGADWKINKQNSIGAFYRYIDAKEEDDLNQHVIGIGYKYKF